MQSLFDFSTPIPHMFIVTTGTLSKEYILYGQKPKECKKIHIIFYRTKRRRPLPYQKIQINTPTG